MVTRTSSASAAPGIDTTVSTAAAPDYTTNAGGGDSNAPGYDVFSIVSGLAANNTLSQAAEEYLARLQELVKTKYSDLEVVRLADPHGAVALVHRDNAIVLLFRETLPASATGVPPAMAQWAAITELRRIRPQQLNVLDAPLILPEDYRLVNQMVAVVINSFASQTDAAVAQMTIKNFASGRPNYVIDTSIQAVKNFVREQHPHAMQPRIDIGLILSAKRPNLERSLVDAQLQESLVPIAAIGGYVELVKVPNESQGRYLPLVRITNITTAIRTPGVVAQAIVLFTEKFLVGQQWKTQFSDFSPKSPNMGALLPDPQDPSRPFHITSVEQREVFVQSNLLPPALAIDVTDGVSRIPSLYFLTDQSLTKRLNDELSRFFGVQISTPSPTYLMNVEYTGQYGGRTGQPQDSRVTFLDLMVTSGSGDAELGKLLYYTDRDPTYRSSVLANYVADFEALHFTRTMNINPYWLGELSKAMLSQGLIITDSRTGNTHTPLDFVVQQGANLAANFSSVTQHMAVGGRPPFWAQQSFYR